MTIFVLLTKFYFFRITSSQVKSISTQKRIWYILIIYYVVGAAETEL